MQYTGNITHVNIVIDTPCLLSKTTCVMDSSKIGDTLPPYSLPSSSINSRGELVMTCISQNNMYYNNKWMQEPIRRSFYGLLMDDRLTVFE